MTHGVSHHEDERRRGERARRQRSRRRRRLPISIIDFRDRSTGFTCPGRCVNDDASLRLRTFIRYANRLIYRHGHVDACTLSLSLFSFLFFIGPRRALDRARISSRAKRGNFSVAGGVFPCAQLALLLFSSSPIIDAPPRMPPLREKFGGKNILPRTSEKKKEDANNPGEGVEGR